MMMKKTGLLAVLTAGVLLLAGCYIKGTDSG